MKLKRILKVFITSSATVFMLSLSSFALYTGSVSVPTLNLRQEPSTSSKILGRLTQNDNVAVEYKKNGWCKVYVNGTVGFVSDDFIKKSQDADFKVGIGKVKTESGLLNVRTSPVTSSKIVKRLSSGQAVSIIGVSNGWYKINTQGVTGYVSPNYIEITKAQIPSVSRGAMTSNESGVVAPSNNIDETRQLVLDYAEQHLGKPYKYGAKGPSAFDCSGYTGYVFKEFGEFLSGTSASQYSDATRIKRSELLPADLVFFGSPRSPSRVNHVGIYVGDGKFIHASSPGDVVKYDTMQSGYYNKYYIGSGRTIFDKA